MPIYEYLCPSCKTKVEIMASLKDKDRGLKPVCPKCGNKNMVRVFGGFAIGSTRGSSFGSSCGPGAGSGCCG